MPYIISLLLPLCMKLIWVNLNIANIKLYHIIPVGLGKLPIVLIVLLSFLQLQQIQQIPNRIENTQNKKGKILATLTKNGKINGKD